MTSPSQSRVPQAVGTTVRATDFLKNLPVRRQTALKNSAKQLAKVKRTLQAYALARPSVRFGLKVLKAKSDKDNWTYAPKSEASVFDAAIKILGKKVIDCCQWHVYCPETLDDEGVLRPLETSSSTTDRGLQYKVETLLPRLDCGKLVH